MYIPQPLIKHVARLVTSQDPSLKEILLHVYSVSICAGIPMEEDEDEQDTSIKGRLLMLVNKIKGQSHKAKEPTEKEQAEPCEEIAVFLLPYLNSWLVKHGSVIGLKM